MNAAISLIYVLHAPKTRMIEARVFAGAHSSSHSIAAAIAVVAQKRPPTNDVLWCQALSWIHIIF